MKIVFSRLGLSLVCCERGVWKTNQSFQIALFWPLLHVPLHFQGESGGIRDTAMEYHQFFTQNSFWLPFNVDGWSEDRFYSRHSLLSYPTISNGNSNSRTYIRVVHLSWRKKKASSYLLCEWATLPTFNPSLILYFPEINISIICTALMCR